MQKYCFECDLKKYCDEQTEHCTLAKHFKKIADFEQAKAEFEKAMQEEIVNVLHLPRDFFKKIGVKKMTRKQLNMATGKNLNRVAEMFGLKRKFLESDKRFRKRILRTIEPWNKV